MALSNLDSTFEVASSLTTIVIDASPGVCEFSLPPVNSTKSNNTDLDLNVANKLPKVLIGLGKEAELLVTACEGSPAIVTL